MLSSIRMPRLGFGAQGVGVGRVLEAAVLIPGGPSEAHGAVPSTSLHSCSVTEQIENCPGGPGVGPHQARGC